MSVISNLLDKFSGGAGVPVIRMKGWRKSSRYLMLHFPASDKCIARTIPGARLAEVSFSVSKAPEQEKWALHIDGETLVADVGNEEEAREVMRRIAGVIAPSRWRWVRRAFVVWLLFALFMPGRSSHAPRPSYGVMPPQMMPAPGAMAGYAAPRGQLAAPPAVLQSAPPQAPSVAPTPTATPAPASVDPFGLQVVPETK